MDNDWQGEGLANNALLVIFSYLILLRRGEVGLTHKILILAYAGSSPAAVANKIWRVGRAIEYTDHKKRRMATSQLIARFYQYMVSCAIQIDSPV